MGLLPAVAGCSGSNEDRAGATGGVNAVAGAGGASSASGGAGVATGGNIGNSGGQSSGLGGSLDNTGGRSPGSGGSSLVAGGASSTTGGTNQNSGGTNQSSGGTNQNSGGANHSSGGRNTATGGTNQSSGGANQGSGGANHSSGGSETYIDAAAMAADMRFGTNIANTFENTAAWETGWGMPLVTQAYIDGMAANGIKTVRVPVAWNTFAVNGVIQADKMARIREVVQWIVDANMYCIVNIHWDGGWIRNEGTSNEYRLTDDVRQKFRSYWEQIGTEFADVGYHLVFEDLNEEGEFYVNGDKDADVPDYAPLNELNQLFVDTVRGLGSYNETRNLLIAGFTTSIDRTCVDAFAIPNDPAGTGRIFVSIHYYEPYTFTLMTDPADWGGMVYPRTTWGTAEDLATRDALYSKMATFASQRNVSIIIGEFTAIPGEGEYVRETNSRIAWLRSVLETSMSHGMVPLLFDANYDIKRADGSFSSDFAAAVNGLVQ